MNLGMYKITDPCYDKALAHLIAELKDVELGFDDEEVYRLLEELGESILKSDSYVINHVIEDVEEPLTKVGDVSMS